MISPLIKWNHTQNWYVGNYDEFMGAERGQRKVIFTPDDKEDEFLKGHAVNGKIVYPAAGYLVIIPKICLICGKNIILHLICLWKGFSLGNTG